MVYQYTYRGVPIPDSTAGGNSFPIPGAICVRLASFGLGHATNSFRVLSVPCGPSVLRGVVRAESWLAPTLPCPFPIYYLV
jgi:hypothetical protein